MYACCNGTIAYCSFPVGTVIEETEFEFSGNEDSVIENEWAIHQLQSAANFAPDNKIIMWFVGELNYQISITFPLAPVTYTTPKSVK